MIIITGQTATGKTELAFEYASKYNGEIVNFDSRQIYKYLDIITGKDLPKKSKVPLRPRSEASKSQKSKVEFKIQKNINNFDIGFYPIPTNSNQFQLISSKEDNLSSEVLPKVRHPRTSEVKLWLYDIITPDQYFSSYDFTVCANIVIEDIIKRGKTPVLVGGTYFYLKHFLYGFDTAPVAANPGLRNELNKKSVAELQAILKKSDNKSYKNMNNSDKNNPRRLIRKIEVSSHQSKTMNNQLPTINYQLLIAKFIGIKYSLKDNLIKAIKSRVQKRLKQGAVDEVESLLKKGYKATDPGLKTIGYQELIKFIKGKISKEDSIEQWVNHEVQYAKRQLTFMKKDKNINWRYI